MAHGTLEGKVALRAEETVVIRRQGASTQQPVVRGSKHYDFGPGELASVDNLPSVPALPTLDERRPCVADAVAALLNHDGRSVLAGDWHG